jgi:Kef-type K+ transport system membrane component KefB
MPLVLGTIYGLLFGYILVPAIVIGSLLASHTLLSLSIVTRLGAVRLEPVIVTIGATVISDTLSLIVFAICVSTYTTGFSVSGLAVQVIEILIFVPLILVGLSRAGAYVLSYIRENEELFFVTMLGIMAIAGMLADLINLPRHCWCVPGRAVGQRGVQDHPAKAKLEFFGRALFIPSFFIVTGLLIAPVTFVRSFVDHVFLVVGIVATLLLGKIVAAATMGRAFGYPAASRLTMWALRSRRLPRRSQRHW